MSLLMYLGDLLYRGYAHPFAMLGGICALTLPCLFPGRYYGNNLILWLNKQSLG